MRLHIFSDLHLEFAPIALPKVDADVVVIAGDVHPGFLGLKWIQETFPSTPVLYVLGNHEFYGKDIPKLTVELKERARGSNIHVLENDRVEIGGVTFLGATLWADFALHGDVMAGQAEAAFQMTDYRRIRVSPAYSKFKPKDSRRLHLESVAWLEKEIQACAGNRPVIITHHAPSPRSLKPGTHHLPIASAYASNLESLIAASNAKLWVHGHIHHSSDYQVGSTRVVANTRGYPDEADSGFNPALIIEV